MGIITDILESPQPGRAMDIVSWRVICTFIFVYACDTILRYVKKKTLFLPFDENRLSIVGGILIGFNWGMFVWAVESDDVKPH